MFKRTNDAAGAAGTGETPDAVQQARTRARRRLIGAVVLLVIGVIGFPLVFETRPRPVPVDIPIEIPRKDNVPPLAMPPARSPDGASAGAPSGTRPAARGGAIALAPHTQDETIITESSADAGREIPPRSAAASAPAAATRASAAERSAAPAPARGASRPAAPASGSEAAARASTAAAAASADAARAKALLDGKPASAAEGPRYVVQVGAFAEADAAHETRLKVEKLGFKTYTQVAETPAGSRIRVRIGPFGSRAEADAALAKARAGGLTAVVLTL